ncbi:hypothetical protein TREMEDRAFT_61541 [Tremella mesenterica DSM 1558]|uniref:uncharacterized protein n=1 Tax=Tremella mesenterica (strain ATCC 24925 / CBS 8224 / DSM 1558 / NBRC 9311 / NRRL Y-6157 / RJB 2259-6 / UBC 559-6) TaxID=578456 RepID=UPI0003F48BEF|nr:uncharacterized protein TREMEDRAFT_61541 [Tremella mesenterica DSM 1558]EIW69774.1 hypothetical protein TREMEDRAFT_61541 [Tremella mesenterica DSM 1558]
MSFDLDTSNSLMSLVYPSIPIDGELTGSHASEDGNHDTQKESPSVKDPKTYKEIMASVLDAFTDQVPGACIALDQRIPEGEISLKPHQNREESMTREVNMSNPSLLEEQDIKDETKKNSLLWEIADRKDGQFVMIKSLIAEQFTAWSIFIQALTRTNGHPNDSMSRWEKSIADYILFSNYQSHQGHDSCNGCTRERTLLQPFETLVNEASKVNNDLSDGLCDSQLFAYRDAVKSAEWSAYLGRRQLTLSHEINKNISSLAEKGLDN